MTKRTLMVLCLAVSAVFLSACQSAAAHLEEGVRKAANAATTGLITAEEAKSIALTDAGNPSATHVRAEFDWDDGVPEYEVEFYTDAQEWEYTIHGETGAVLNKNVENKRKSPETTTPSPAQSAPQRITAEEAEAIALNHAGLTAEAVTKERTEFDLDDGVPEYEIEFRGDGWEYDYEIHAETGAIRTSQKEKEDGRQTKPVEKEVTSPATEPVKSDPTAKITAEEAEAIALKHAGLSRADVIMDRTEYDPFDRVPEYEIEFRVDGWEYSYEVHAETGKILSAEKEWDD